ncbi:dephospho-CoA kinase [Cellvibrio mixtus]|uniref:dephospho-CoA kinase n=1 Tax=Cellvibrio mixtus TaxID=39650 RepID=UPI0005877943|nr:dephospho-CoA kinase [Cellvibrio mixtus]
MANKKLIVGLTGGIGSGKSEVCRRFIAKGITVVDADIVAREVVEPGTPALELISGHFGENILLTTENQRRELNRARLREIIFSNPSEKDWLERTLHPIINQRIREQLKNAAGPYVILASPLLLETRQYLLVDRILVIDASEQLQIERASQRDFSNEAQIKAIMQTQLSRQERCARANDIIQNHGSLIELDEQVGSLHKLYMELAQNN